MIFLLPIKDKKRWGQYHTARPDGDNLVKMVLDRIQHEKTEQYNAGVQPLLIDDDTIISSARFTKIYDQHGGLILKLKPIEKLAGHAVLEQFLKPLGVESFADLAAV